LGGDEFTILLEDLKDPSDAIRVAQRIHAALAEPFLLSGQEVFKGASIGIAFTSGVTSAESLMTNADIAMYRAKSNGKSRCEIFDSAMHDQVTKRLELETALRWAIDRGEFRLHYQPIVSLTSGRVAGFEALLRWQRPEVGIVPPDAFIAVAEAVGLIVPIGKWVLNEACREAASWNRLREQPVYVSINVSGRQFSYPGFVEHVREALFMSHVDPALVTLEVTETTAMVDAVHAEGVMGQLRALGVKLSIDDFGTGYSSLSSLRRFPLSTLKIDRSFVSTMHLNPQSCAIVNTIVALARNLEMEVVAEGIENVEQLEKLRASCDSGQGYLFSKAIPAEGISAFLASDSTGKLMAVAAVAGNGRP
jgi:predicted signal transduction protein with EAL and GGDEF domain